MTNIKNIKNKRWRISLIYLNPMWKREMHNDKKKQANV